jgi:cytochrome P450
VGTGARAAGKAEAAEGVSEAELLAVVSLALVASVDTTSSIVNWCLTHLARHPPLQQRVRLELREALAAAPLATVIADAERQPYLKAFIRETHRVTPSLANSSVKQTDCDLELGGYAVPAGSLVALDNRTLSHDPRLVPDHKAFRPERWLPAEVEARKGTPAEIIDHRLLAAPFSAGARMCPGSRIAQIEVRAMLSCLLNDWHIAFAEPAAVPDELPYHFGTTLSPSPMPKLSFTPAA